MLTVHERRSLDGLCVSILPTSPCHFVSTTSSFDPVMPSIPNTLSWVRCAQWNMGSCIGIIKSHLFIKILYPMWLQGTSQMTKIE